MSSVGGESDVAVVEPAKELSEEPPLPEGEIPEGAAVEVAEDPHADKREDATVEVIEEPRLPEAEIREDAAVEVIEEPRLSEAEIREDASVEVAEEPHVDKREDATVEVIEEPRLPEAEIREDATVEVIEEPRLQEAEILEDAAVEVIEEPRLPEAEVCANASVEVAEEPHVDKREEASVEVIEEPRLPEAEIREDAVVEVTEEPHVDKREEALVEVIEEPRLPEAEICEDATVKLTEEQHVDKREDASVEGLEQKFAEVMGAGIDDKVDNGAVTSAKAMGNETVVQEVVPAPKRKLPSVQRFSARRSAGVDGRYTLDDGWAANGDAGADSMAPSAIRKQRGAFRSSPRMDMAIDDRDTVDYGLVTTDDPLPKPVEARAVAEQAVPTTSRKAVLSVAEREQLRLQNIQRNKEIICLERIRGKLVNITAGLELHTGVFSRVEQQKLVDLVRDLQAKGRRNELKERTYSEPKKWMRGKGRVTLQFGCCYNYAVDRNGNPPGILREEVVDPIPPLLRATIKRLVRWHVVPPTCVPDSCIINMYEEGDCIPPHIDHHDFLRPFCTLSLVSKCNIVFGVNLEVLGPGDFGGSLSLPLPVGSVLVLNGNGADVAKHAVPAVPTERISITFRKMDPAKVPRGFTIDKELQNLRPVALPAPQVDDS